MNATPAEAFRAFTEDIGRWWRPNGLFQFSEGRNGTLAFESGSNRRLVETYDDGTAFIIGPVRVWDPPRRLVVGWRHATFADDQETELHVRFEPVDRQTRVTVEHFGWDSIPADHAARHGIELVTFQLRYAQWWQTVLASLNSHRPN